MAMSMGFGSPTSLLKGGKNKRRIFRGTVSASLKEQYTTLRVQPGASEKEVKKAFRQLALQYHPDVCKGSNCGVQFHRINEAYDIVMNKLREAEEEEEETLDSSWEFWEEWMGWEGAGIRDFSNPYI
ncbi:hypothetical protein QJS10_CPA02g01319 [Acorus calamus]|uniref:J domain-containing protein n=1 Tax=Acorus calamus TaxID=4465 RepID=A0AAV9FCM0_ACOCL|nr:hypothetical protein QJS10_CPA02g01319 [Acorus calamus]